MEFLSSSSEAVERAMIDPESLALKRARSPSPEGAEGSRQLVVASKKGPRTARVIRKETRGRKLALLPASASSDLQVSDRIPCMPLLVEGVSASSPQDVEGDWVEVPVKAGGSSAGGDTSSKGEVALRVCEEGEVEVGSGTVSRGPPSKNKGKMSQGKAGGGEVRAGKASAPPSPCGTGLKVSKGSLRGKGGCRGLGSDRGVVEGDQAEAEGAGKARAALFSPSPKGTEGRGQGRAGRKRSEGEGRKGGDKGSGVGRGQRDDVRDSPVASADCARQRSRSPVRRRGALFPKKTNSPGQKGREDDVAAGRHGELVKRVNAAVRGRSAVEGDGGAEEGEGGGEAPGEPSEP